MSKPQTLKQINKARVLDKLSEHSALSRADLARELNLMRSTVGNLVESLCEDAVLREVDESKNEANSVRVGRPSTKFELNPDHCYYLVVDIDSRKPKLFLFDFSMREIGYAELDGSTLFDHPKQAKKAAHAIARNIKDLCANAHVGMQDLVACFFIFPALVDREGRIGYCPSLKWADVNFGALMAEHLPEGVQIVIENDANAFALCDLNNRPQPGETNSIYFWLDDGVGGGLIFNGALVRGFHGFAGEFGHIYTDALKASPHVPLPESAENIIGRTGLLHQYEAASGERIRFVEFMERLNAGEVVALEIFEKWCEILAQSLGSLIGILNPETIVFGGPLAVLVEKGREKILEDLENYVMIDRAVASIETLQVDARDIALGCAHMMRRDYLHLSEEEIFA